MEYKYSGKLSVRLTHKTKEKESKPALLIRSDITKYLDSSTEYDDIKKIVPLELLKKYKKPPYLYLINKKSAREIVHAIKDKLNSSSPIIEIDPGFGLITEELLKCQSNHVYMYEKNGHLFSQLPKLLQIYPEQASLKCKNFFSLWKLAFHDKEDGGNRVENLLGELYTNDKFNAGRNVNIVGSMPGLTSAKGLVNNIIHDQIGQPNIFMYTPSQHYESLVDTKSNLAQQTLFELLFKVTVVMTVPREHFLPWTLKTDSKKMDEGRIHLVHITLKEQLPCAPKYLQLFYYFIKKQTFSKFTPIIPKLEQWIPGCGVRLITGQDPPDTNKELGPKDGDAKLPLMTIFTQFHDLDLEQKVTLFKRFISWPEFEQSSFRKMMEDSLFVAPEYPYNAEGDRNTTNFNYTKQTDHDNKTEENKQEI